MVETLGSETVLTKVLRIAKLARENPTMVLTTLAHNIDIEWMREAYAHTRKNGAVGVDGQTAEEYAQNLDANLAVLLERAKSGSYRAPPVRRVHIPKGTDGETRPIGIPTFEDKVLQRAVVMVLEAVYEQVFLDCSYGFRLKRSQHQALEALRNKLMAMKGGTVVEVDIRKFFENVDRGHMREFLRQRVRDGVLLRLIDKWLNAGVQEFGATSYPDAGTPQGGVISPLLSNVYLHYVLDEWFEKEVKPKLTGQAHLIRYADDAVMAFANEADAHRMMAVLPKRLGKFGLTLHPEKTRMLAFGRPPARGPNDNTKPPDDQGPGTFDMLGFTHYWARSRKGYWVIKCKTAKDRVRRAIQGLAQWCRQNMHEPVREQSKQLCAKLHGHYNYYGITCNIDALRQVYRATKQAWRHWLDRRSSRAHMTWAKMDGLLKRYPLPTPKIVHSNLLNVANP
jgi:group II intron reverse transcriptase/maturase